MAIPIDMFGGELTVDQEFLGNDTDLQVRTIEGDNTLILDGIDTLVSASVGDGQNPTSLTVVAQNGANVSLINPFVPNLSYRVVDSSTMKVDPGFYYFGTQKVTFEGDGAGTFALDHPFPMHLPRQFEVHGFSKGDTLNVTGASHQAFSYQPGAEGAAGVGVLTFNGMNPSYFNLQNLSPEDAQAISDAVDAANRDGQTAAFTMPVCFTRGTRILTPTGEKAVELLQAGDLVMGQSGVRTVKWVGYRKNVTAAIPEAARSTHMPIRIMRDAIAHNVPSSDICVSPGHHVLIDGVLIRAMDILNGKTIVQETHLTQYDYFHVELDQFDVISAHGLMSESWADGGNRDYFQNVDVTTLRPQDMTRRKADRPGFVALRKAKDIAIVHAKVAKRAIELTRDGGQRQAA